MTLLGLAIFAIIGLITFVPEEIGKRLGEILVAKNRVVSDSQKDKG